MSQGKLLSESEIEAPPSERTVARIIEEFEQLKPSEQEPYTLLSWPAAFESGALPWESSSALMELLYFARDAGLARPTVELARIFWNATISAPGADLLTRIEITARLALGKTEGMEGYLGRKGYLPKDGRPPEPLPPRPVFDLTEGRTATVLFGLPLLIPGEEAAAILGVKDLKEITGRYLATFSGEGKRRPGVMLGAVLELAENIKEGRIAFLTEEEWRELESKEAQNDG